MDSRNEFPVASRCVSSLSLFPRAANAGCFCHHHQGSEAEGQIGRQMGGLTSEQTSSKDRVA